MLGFVPTAQQNFETTQNHSDRMRKTRSQNLAEMQRLMKEAAAMGQEITPEWLASVEQTMITPETMMMGISPREAISRQMVEAANRQSEASRMQQELQGLQTQQQSEGVIETLYGQLLDAGKTPEEAMAEFSAKYPGIAQQALPRLPELGRRYQLKKSAEILNDKRLDDVLDESQLDDSFKLPYTKDAVANRIKRNRAMIAEKAATDVFREIQGSMTGEDIDGNKERARKALARFGYRADDDLLSEIADRATGMYRNDLVGNQRELARSVAPTVASGAFQMAERAETRRIEQRNAANQEAARMLGVFEQNVTEFQKWLKDSKTKFENSDEVVAILGNINFRTPEAKARFISLAKEKGGYKALNEMMEENEDQFETRSDLMKRAELMRDARSGELQPEQFMQKWKADADQALQERLFKLRQKHAAGQLAELPAKEAEAIQRYKEHIAKLESLAKEISIVPSVDPYDHISRISRGLVPGQPYSNSYGGYQPQANGYSPQQQGQPVQAKGADQVAPIVISAAASYGVPPSYLMAMAEVESSMGVNRVGPETPYGRATGLFQYIPDTARRLGINPQDDYQAAQAAAMQFAGALRSPNNMYGNPVAWAIAHHHAGPDPRQHGPKTAEYVRRVMEAQRRYAYLDDPSVAQQQQQTQQDQQAVAAVDGMQERSFSGWSGAVTPDQAAEARRQAAARQAAAAGSRGPMPSVNPSSWLPSVDFSKVSPPPNSRVAGR